MNSTASSKEWHRWAWTTHLAPLIALGCMPQASQAWGSLILLEPSPQTDTLSMGASYWGTPRSPDGHHTDHAVLPALDYERHDGWFVSTETGVGYNASQTDQWQAGWRLWPQLGRARQDSSTSLPHVGPRLQAQGFANALVGNLVLLQSAFSAGSGQHHDGAQTELGLTSGIPWSSGLLGLGLAATYGNRAYRRDYTGNAHTGWTDWSWSINVDQKLSESWHLDGQFQQARILQPYASSNTSSTPWRPSTLLLTLWRTW